MINIFYFLSLLQGAIIHSTGSIENNERIGQIMLKLVQITSTAQQEPFDRISLLYKDHSYSIVKSGRSIKVLHKSFSDDTENDL